MTGRARDGLEMPDLVSPRRGFRHRMESAVATLRALGVSDDRIIIEGAGGGWATGTVVSQLPASGAVLHSGARVELRVAGFGALQSLPFAMRTEDEHELGADRLMALFDHEWYRALVHLRAAAGLFDLTADDPVAARRFAEDLFLVAVDDFAPDTWYRLARALPLLPSFGGLDEAISVILPFVTGIPVRRVRTVAAVAEPELAGGTRLGQRDVRLGVDVWLGPSPVSDRYGCEVELGPVALDGYLEQIGDQRVRERRALYRLLLPTWVVGDPQERWCVGDPSAGCRLGLKNEPTRLGANSYLGSGISPREHS